MKNRKTIACAVLAGGKSSRMGKDKAFLKYQDRTFLEMICQTLEDTNIFEEKIIALGNRMLPERNGWQLIRDRYLEKGPLGGIDAVAHKTMKEAVFLISCDVPFINGDLIKRICDNFSGREAVAVMTGDGRKQPLCGIYKTAFLMEAEAAICSGNYRLLHFLEQSEITWISPTKEEESCLININTPWDYRKWISEGEAGNEVF